ncbi:MAG: DNA alkylation repair protein [Myxococcaceae bacterium]|nr:DNA alkylation repair protein [Myxococcaceae bacterium]
MAEPLKNFFSGQLVRRLAESLSRVHPSFPSAAFVRRASAGLEALELIDRGKHIAAALGDALPADYPQAVDVLVRSLGAERVGEEGPAGMEPFFYLPHTIFIADRGVPHFDVSLKAQAELTKRFTCEFSIRPFIAAEPERTLAALKRFARDENAHVRRLASEGTRLRLPWGARVKWLDAHPEAVLELLELLRDDPSEMVRRSVANNLNDLGKVHPKLLYATCKRWLNVQRRPLIEHALRSAVKRGEREALTLLGYGQKPQVELGRVRFEPPKPKIGEKVRVHFALKSRAAKAQELLVDVAVHFVKASGKTAPKVFKLDRVTLSPKAEVELDVLVSLQVLTTRKPNPGRHPVDVLINGVKHTAGAFHVR